MLISVPRMTTMEAVVSTQSTGDYVNYNSENKLILWDNFEMFPYLFCFLLCAYSRVLNILAFGAVYENELANITNQRAILHTLSSAKNGDTVLIPSGTIYSLGGIEISNLYNITVQLDGNLVAVPDFNLWPFSDGSYHNFIDINDSMYLRIIGNGYCRGSGVDWWNKVVFPEIYGRLKGARPKMFVLSRCKNIYISDIHFENSPSWNLVLDDVSDVEVNRITVTTNREELTKISKRKSKNLFSSSSDRSGVSRFSQSAVLDLQPEDLNTDGIDVIGQNVWIHDSQVQNDDDSVAVKPCSRACQFSDCTRNILVSNMVLTGFGASIGSVPPSKDVNCVENVTFANISMPYTGKGIYIKSNPGCERINASGIISNILYHNITIEYPRWWAIWIGPQQMHEPGSSLGFFSSPPLPPLGILFHDPIKITTNSGDK
eukprot:TRINITY_DN8934_c0_g1_i7.p1 TRINITY_DN8934_c0_g1~~TRINITY_DN8934_c0_g1_i7.p1  ORF type:complete len:431 (-),score=66.61 TRINITY_DN8934_c0_g1_i7:426-1718(-)